MAQPVFPSNAPRSADRPNSDSSALERDAMPPRETWSAAKSAQLYQVQGWGAPYFSVSENGHIAVRPNAESECKVDLFELTQDLNTILRHMEALGSVDSRGVEETSGIGATGTRLRKDERAPIAMDEAVASIAPEMRDGLIIVPRLATHEDAEESSA